MLFIHKLEFSNRNKLFKTYALLGKVKKEKIDNNKYEIKFLDINDAVIISFYLDKKEYDMFMEGILDEG